MSFTYIPGTPVFIVRSLIPDTDSTRAIFSDEEINGYLWLNSTQSLYTSGQAVPTAASFNATPVVYSYRRAAAQAIDVIASSRSRRAILEQVLDVKLSAAAIKGLHDMADSLRAEDENGNYAIAEMVFDPFSARERAVAQLQRLQGG